jgi:hypothetical protein
MSRPLLIAFSGGAWSSASPLQLGSLPLLNLFSPLAELREAARVPSMIGAALQVMNGVVFIGEGIQQAFESLGVTTGRYGMVLSLRLYGSSLVGVWASFLR